MINLFTEKGNVAKVLRGFEVVVDDFPAYVMLGVSMSTSWRLHWKMPELYVIVKGMPVIITFKFPS